ncbi:PepSY-associated TM helix domain-containing protein [Neobacillus novalis]|uniref:PepSY-associated TM helix domain-containing protein n=1 Tax=Neobacillus novalis TaxID=220687 RepID=A0AA95SAM9_9BACI|nr:PepSY-associated TM helix domain-containing protein [Neobacillus novalis]WHY88305.1 PepSY-associated TM helix domain-containing protein [Neobacillus novalis]
MKKTRRAHLWIGLIASVFIFIEALSGLLMNEPWLIGQSQPVMVGGNFQPGQFRQGQVLQGRQDNFDESNGQPDGQAPDQGQSQWQRGTNGNGQFQGRRGLDGNGNFAAGFRREGMGQGSALSIIRGLHEGRIGNTNIKWLLDLVALAMMFLTGTGIYLSFKVLGAERKRKKHHEDNIDLT